MVVLIPDLDAGMPYLHRWFIYLFSFIWIHSFGQENKAQRTVVQTTEQTA